MTEYVVVLENLTVKKIDMEESEIVNAIDSGFFESFMKLDEEGEIIYADTSGAVIEWKRPLEHIVLRK